MIPPRKVPPLTLKLGYRNGSIRIYKKVPPYYEILIAFIFSQLIIVIYSVLLRFIPISLLVVLYLFTNKVVNIHCIMIVLVLTAIFF